MYSERLVIVLNDIAHRYKDLMYRAVHAVLSQPPYKNTGAGATSLKVEVVNGDTHKAPAILVNFDDHLIFLNQRKIQWTRWPDMKELARWAETKTTDPEEAQRLVWGTAWKQKNFDTWKPKPWRKKSLSGVLKEMNEHILKAFDQAIDDDFQTAANL